MKARLVLRPRKNIDFYGTAEWDHYDLEFTKSDLSLILQMDRSGNKKDRIKVDYEYEKGGDKDLRVFMNVNLFRGFSAGGSYQRDYNVKHTVTTTYWAEYTSQCWAVRFGIEKEDDDTDFMVLFRLFGLADFKAL